MATGELKIITDHCDEVLHQPDLADVLRTEYEWFRAYWKGAWSLWTRCVSSRDLGSTDRRAGRTSCWASAASTSTGTAKASTAARARWRSPWHSVRRARPAHRAIPGVPAQIYRRRLGRLVQSLHRVQEQQGAPAAKLSLAPSRDQNLSDADLLVQLLSSAQTLPGIWMSASRCCYRRCYRQLTLHSRQAARALRRRGRAHRRVHHHG